ncbi:hypothetical protein P4S83_17175 [Aneurinibacillus thermoaerophilus]|uniref:hypothetical protein n=1 Tax=Aneurinibacillus thermoaerophilus TaxID=143495 RepID=UPI002E23B616|nr:hypothetical protein [Aneurinibacillus thermoaerophilus]MED0764490.1 hypothetical protein [Aneurinibacillus thermoaerophilus]
MNKRYLSRIDQTGAILLPEDLQKLVHAGKLDVYTENSQLVLKNPKPDYVFTWMPEQK